MTLTPAFAHFRPTDSQPEWLGMGQGPLFEACCAWYTQMHYFHMVDLLQRPDTGPALLDINSTLPVDSSFVVWPERIPPTHIPLLTHNNTRTWLKDGRFDPSDLLTFTTSDIPRAIEVLSVFNVHLHHLDALSSSYCLFMLHVLTEGADYLSTDIAGELSTLLDPNMQAYVSRCAFEDNVAGFLQVLSASATFEGRANEHTYPYIPQRRHSM